MPRFYCSLPLTSGADITLPPTAARHVQVLRLQPDDDITLFDGRGGEYSARVTRMGRSDVDVQVGEHFAIEREAPVAVHLISGMPANERRKSPTRLPIFASTHCMKAPSAKV